MATQQTATVRIVNNFGGDAWILFYHSNSSNGTQSKSSIVQDTWPTGALTVYFKTGFGTEFVLDYWSVLVHVKNGPNAGFYVTSGTDLVPFWAECQLQKADANQLHTFTVSPTELVVKLKSGACRSPMTKLAPSPRITHVFVVMLENHSFDNIFAFSEIPGITAATTADFNPFDGEKYFVQSSAPLSMPTDPGHEFPDTVEQLAGEGATYPPRGPYPPIDNSGFVANYATTHTEGSPPEHRDIGEVMACFATRTQLPVSWNLATAFALCDQWHSSIPGPTWPNRFFVHGASSSGLDASPSTTQMGEWELPGFGFEYPNGSIYDALRAAKIPYRIYNDTTGLAGGELSLYSDDPQRGSSVGAVPQVSSLKGVSLLDSESLQTFAADLQGPYPWPYTFIEPHYGDLTGGTYAGGSSQHPMDDVFGGENLLTHVYSAIRNSPYWETSLLIVTYDEHGGFYDSVAPQWAPAPGDNPDYGYNQFGFDFELYGVRVPAMVASPLIPEGTVDHTLYDHASVLKTLEDLFGLKPLTQRDTAAKSLVPLLSLKYPRMDCPTSLGPPAPLLMAAAPRLSAEERAARDAEPMPLSGNLVGALQILRKTEIEMSAGTPAEIAAIHARHAALRTRGDARAYAASVMERVGAVKEARKQAARARP